MEKYQCVACKTFFSGPGAYEEIVDHLEGCVIVRIQESEEMDLEKRLEESVPGLEKVEITQPRYDVSTKLAVTRKDGGTYTLEFERVKGFDVYVQGIKNVEEKIQEILALVLNSAPTSDIRFIRGTENGGYLGNGLVFSIKVGLERKEVTGYQLFSASQLSSYVAKIAAHYSVELTGALEGLNGNFVIEGVSVNDWLHLNRGKKVEIKISKDTN